ncbi:hypothetical protein NFI96_010376 [Prochilodus magdalenae]|nr:hypothetical protein NFI96_010376 [Prochilodus magdalenae]
MHTANGAAARMGPLQRDVYLRLGLPIFFTAFLFFVDVFIETKACNVDTEGQTFNASQQGSGEEGNISHQSNFSHHTNGSVCTLDSSFAYGQATYMTGLLIGSILGGTLSDKSVMITSVIRRVEWSLPKYRIWPTTLLSFIFSLGMMALAAVAYFTNSWMQFHLALAIPQILCLPLYFSIPESPRWLLLNKRTHILENYRSRSPEDRHYLDLLLDTVGNECLKKTNEETDNKKVSDFTHFKSATIILRLFIMSFIGQKCVGLVSLCYRVGCIVNAVVAPKGGVSLGAMICYSSGPILGAGLCLLLPETSGIPLPDTVQDCEKQPSLKLGSCCTQ